MSGKLEDPKERLELILSGLSGKKDGAELCKEAGISRELYYRWLDRVREQALKALAPKESGPGRKEATSKDVKKLEARVEKLSKKLSKARKETEYLGMVVKTAQKIIRRNAWGILPLPKKNSARDEKPGTSISGNGMTPGETGSSSE